MNATIRTNPSPIPPQEVIRGDEAPQVIAERARVKRQVENGNAGQDAHTRALAGHQTMAHFQKKLVSL